MKIEFCDERVCMWRKMLKTREDLMEKKSGSRRAYLKHRAGGFSGTDGRRFSFLGKKENNSFNKEKLKIFLCLFSFFFSIYFLDNKLGFPIYYVVIMH